MRNVGRASENAEIREHKSYSTCSLTATMAPLAVKIKHAGKIHDVQLDPDQSATVFKDAVYQVTGVPLERMKVMIKGGVLKVCLSYLYAC